MRMYLSPEGADWASRLHTAGCVGIYPAAADIQVDGIGSGDPVGGEGEGGRAHGWHVA